MHNVNNLVDEVKKGNQKAFEELINMYLPMIYEKCISSIKRKYDIEDAVQEIIIRIWEKIPLYDNKKGQFSTWVITLTNNQLISIYRRKKDIVISDELEIDNIVFNVSNNIKDTIKDLYLQLSKIEYEILIYHIVYHVSFEDLADMCNTTTYEIKKIYRKVKTIAKKYYSDEKHE